MSQALLLMDIQNGILDRVGAGEPYLDEVVAAQERAEAAGIPWCSCESLSAQVILEISTRNKSFSAAALRSSMVVGDLAVEPRTRARCGATGEILVTKKRISAFAGSDLDMVLRSRDVTHLVLAGISTSGVVLSTVREAADARLSAHRARRPLPGHRRRGSSRAHDKGVSSAGRRDRRRGLAP